MTLANRLILVTGASRGIGAATVRLLASRGAFVIINYRQSQAEAEALAAWCDSHGGGGWAIQADMREPSEVAAMLQDIQTEFGKLDGLVFNTGVQYRFDAQQRAFHWDTSRDAYEAAFSGTVGILHDTLQAALPLLEQSERASVVVLSSNLVRRPLVTYHTYNVAKGAIEAYVQNAAIDLAALGIRMNTVAPGMVYPTAATVDSREETKSLVIAQTPLQRTATTEDVAGVIAFFMSDDSRFLIGQTLYVDGGLSI